MQPPDLPRFRAMQRREFLRRAATAGAVALVPGVLVACSKDDKDVFASTDSSTSPTPSTSTVPSTGETTEPSTAASSTTAGGGAPLPDSAQVEVAFTYAAADGGVGPARNPFIAVWVESAAGDLVANLSLWYNPPKGDRWINHLANWYAADEAYFEANGTDDVESITGATRPAGTYSVLWDGLDAADARAPQGDYVLFIESAREHGPNSLTSAAMSLGSAAVDASFADDGELSAATARYTV